MLKLLEKTVLRDSHEKISETFNSIM